MPRRLLAASLALVVVAGAVTVGSRSGRDEGAGFDDPVAALATAARSHRVVLIGEIHGWVDQHRVLREVIADPRFAGAFDDIVVEFGNARSQRLVDAYTAGGEVAESTVSRAWLQTTQGDVWAHPVYAAFFRAVRDHNLRSARKLRIVLGDPPMPPTELSGRRDFWLLQRDPHFAVVVHREVLSRGRRALVIAGAGHVARRPGGVPTLSNLLEGSARCEPDPLSVAAGIDWCDDLRRFRPLGGVYVVLAARAAALAALDEGLAVRGGTIHDLDESPLRDVAVSKLVGGTHATPLAQAADAILVVG